MLNLTEAQAAYFYCKALGYDYTAMNMFDILGIICFCMIVIILMLEGYWHLKEQLKKGRNANA